MLILIEGVDCTQKSTLAERLAKELTRLDPDSSVEILHKGPPTSHPLDEYVLPLVDYRPGTGRHIICDRWHWGEAVYPSIMGRDSQLDDATFWYIEAFLRSRGALMLRTTVDARTHVKCLMRRGDRYISQGHVADLNRGYLTVAGRSHLPVRVVNNPGTYDLDEIITHAAWFDLCASTLRNLTTYVGPYDPDFLIIGDVRNRVDGDDDRRPAFMPYPGTSGHYLLSHLKGVRTRKLGIINACDVDDADYAFELFMHPNVVTLGVNADRKFIKRHSTVPHPQYVRRFHHKAGQAYGELIDGALAIHTEALAWRP